MRWNGWTLYFYFEMNVFQNVTNISRSTERFSLVQPTSPRCKHVPGKAVNHNQRWGTAEREPLFDLSPPL